jgi:hypothetical protein
MQDSRGGITTWWLEWFRSLKNQFPLITVDTTSGNRSIALPIGAIYMNQERTYAKSSADGNTVTITGALGGPVVMTAQYENSRFRYDGKNWWVVG